MNPELDKVEPVVETSETPEVPEVKLSVDELRAQEEGWVPKDQWKGAEEDWVSAKAFLKYGQVESELKRVRSDASQKEKVIKTMKDYYLNVKDDAKKEVLDTLKRHKREAIKDENYAEVAKIDVQIDELTDNLDRRFKASDEGVKKAEQALPQTPPPEFFDWNKKNSWYKLGETAGLTKEADVLAVAYAQQHPNANYQDVLNYVGETIRVLHKDKFEATAPKREVPTDVNEPGEVQGESSSKRKVKLTAAEKMAADQFGMTYEEYAKDLQKWDASRERA